MIAANFVTGILPEAKGKVSAKFLKGARKAINIYKSWGLRNDVDLSRFTPVEHTDGGGRVGAFFTLGVDSFYTLLRNINEIDDIIYVKGFERKLSRDVLEQIREKMNQVGRLFGKQAIFWISDIRDNMDRYVNWQPFGHGPALAAEALLRENIYKKIFIPGTNDTPIIHCASHPDIDPLWSTETLEFVHHGVISRLEKIKYIAEKSQCALDLIRVCYQGDNYNCNKCTKCVRTIISLNLLGLHSASFGRRPSLETINKHARKTIAKGELYLPGKNPRWPLWEQNIKEAEQLLKALKGQL